MDRSGWRRGSPTRADVEGPGTPPSAKCASRRVPVVTRRTSLSDCRRAHAVVGECRHAARLPYRADTVPVQPLPLALTDLDEPRLGTEWRRGRQPSFDRLGGLRRPAERRMDDL